MNFTNQFIKLFDQRLLFMSCTSICCFPISNQRNQFCMNSISLITWKWGYANSSSFSSSWNIQFHYLVIEDHVTYRSKKIKLRYKNHLRLIWIVIGVITPTLLFFLKITCNQILIMIVHSVALIYYVKDDKIAFVNFHYRNTLILKSLIL